VNLGKDALETNRLRRNGSRELNTSLTRDYCNGSSSLPRLSTAKIPHSHNLQAKAPSGHVSRRSCADSGLQRSQEHAQAGNERIGSNIGRDALTSPLDLASRSCTRKVTASDRPLHLIVRIGPNLASCAVLGNVKASYRRVPDRYYTAIAVSGKIAPRGSSRSCGETFPWLQDPGSGNTPTELLHFTNTMRAAFSGSRTQARYISLRIIAVYTSRASSGTAMSMTEGRRIKGL
jgi:hypothetical protein